jgi:hypothetical protein
MAMSRDTMHISLKKAEAVLEAATPDDLNALNATQLRWLVHAAADYVQEALEDLEEDMGLTPACRGMPHA